MSRSVNESQHEQQKSCVYCEDMDQHLTSMSTLEKLRYKANHSFVAVCQFPVRPNKNISAVRVTCQKKLGRVGTR